MGAKIAVRAVQNSNVAVTGWTSGHASEVCRLALVLPSSSRAAAVTALIGFHSARVCTMPGMPSVGTNVLATNVSGKSTMNPTPMTASGSLTMQPSRTPSQVMLRLNRSMRATARKKLGTVVCGRQPIARPVSIRMVRVRQVTSMSLETRPTSSEEREVGRASSRSTKPDLRSLARPRAVPKPVKARVWTKMPGIRKSR